MYTHIYMTCSDQQTHLHIVRGSPLHKIASCMHNSTPPPYPQRPPHNTRTPGTKNDLQFLEKGVGDERGIVLGHPMLELFYFGLALVVYRLDLLKVQDIRIHIHTGGHIHTYIDTCTYVIDVYIYVYTWIQPHFGCSMSAMRGFFARSFMFSFHFPRARWSASDSRMSFAVASSSWLPGSGCWREEPPLLEAASSGGGRPG